MILTDHPTPNSLWRVRDVEISHVNESYLSQLFTMKFTKSNLTNLFLKKSNPVIELNSLTQLFGCSYWKGMIIKEK